MTTKNEKPEATTTENIEWLVKTIDDIVAYFDVELGHVSSGRLAKIKEQYQIKP